MATSLNGRALLAVDVDIQLPTLTRPKVSEIAHATLQQGVGLVTSLRFHALSAVDQGQRAASRRVGKPMARRGAAFAWSGVSKAKVTFTKVKSKSAKIWTPEAQYSAGMKAHAALGIAASRARKLAASAREVAADECVRTTAASAVGGAVALGTTGGVAGLTTGTVVGAAVGLVPALFTLGASIPIGAAIGGTCGLVTGAAAGSTVGAVGGGVAGYGAHAKGVQITSAVDSSRNQIASVASQTIMSVNDSAEYAKQRALTSAGYIKDTASAVRTRLFGGLACGASEQS